MSKTLDEILNRLAVMLNVGDPQNKPLRPDDLRKAREATTQAIQQAIDEAIGEDEIQLGRMTTRFAPSEGNREELIRDVLRAQIRERMKERGLL